MGTLVFSSLLVCGFWTFCRTSLDVVLSSQRKPWAEKPFGDLIPDYDESSCLVLQAKQEFLYHLCLLEAEHLPSAAFGFRLSPENRSKERQEPPNCSLQRNWIWIIKFSCLKETIFFIVFECRGSLWFVTFTVFMNKRLAFRRENIPRLFKVLVLQYVNWRAFLT